MTHGAEFLQFDDAFLGFIPFLFTILAGFRFHIQFQLQLTSHKCKKGDKVKTGLCETEDTISPYFNLKILK